MLVAWIWLRVEKELVKVVWNTLIFLTIWNREWNTHAFHHHFSLPLSTFPFPLVSLAVSPLPPPPSGDISLSPSLTFSSSMLSWLFSPRSKVEVGHLINCHAAEPFASLTHKPRRQRALFRRPELCGCRVGNSQAWEHGALPAGMWRFLDPTEE